MRDRPGPGRTGATSSSSSAAPGRRAPGDREPAPSAFWRTSKALVRGLAVATSPLRPWPEFLIIGTKRGGTTSLYRYLELHPAVLPLVPSSRYLPLQDNIKGVRFFDTGFSHGPRWYRSHFPTSAARRLAGRPLGVAPITGEATPYYLFHPRAAERAAAVVGHAKVIVLLRDPVERAHSHYAERRANGTEPLSFEAALEAEPGRLAGERERMDRDPTYTSFAHQHQSYVAQSRYADSLARWKEHFPPEQLLVLCSEEFYADPEHELERVHAFLGLPHQRPPDLSPRNAIVRETMSDPVRRHLDSVFADDVRELERVAGRTFPWSPSGRPVSANHPSGTNGAGTP
jgi:hypothetical protein